MSNYMGERIHQKRIEKGMTMEELASMLDVGKSAVNKWEKGHITNIKRPTIEKMAQIFDCSPSWLMGWEAQESEENADPHPLTEAEKMFELYQQASPDVRAAVEILLKGKKSDS